MTIEECEEVILRAADTAAPAFDAVGNHIASGTAEAVRGLVAANERGVAFEALCVNLIEYDIRIDRRTKDALGAAGSFMGLDESLWSALEVAES